MAITIEAEPKAQVQVELVGHTYTVSPPKAALALRIGVTAKQVDNDPSVMYEAILDWLRAALNKRDYGRVVSRLDDPEDLLDIDHIALLIEKVSEHAAGNPTSSS